MERLQTIKINHSAGAYFITIGGFSGLGNEKIGCPALVTSCFRESPRYFHHFRSIAPECAAAILFASKPKQPV